MAKNDITGDEIRSRPTSKVYAEQWEVIYGNKPENFTIDHGSSHQKSRESKPNNHDKSMDTHKP